MHVIPRCGRTEIVGRHGDALKVRVKEAPVDGRATEAARLAVASALGVGAGAVRLESGERSRHKRFRIAGLGLLEAERRLAPWLGSPEG